MQIHAGTSPPPPRSSLHPSPTVVRHCGRTQGKDVGLNRQSRLVLFNAVIGAVDLDTEEGRARVVGAITDTGAEGARFRSLCDIILGIASDAAHEHLEELMGITYKSKFVNGWYQQGRAAGEAKGKAEGIAEGEARGA